MNAFVPHTETAVLHKTSVDEHIDETACALVQHRFLHKSIVFVRDKYKRILKKHCFKGENKRHPNRSFTFIFISRKKNKKKYIVK